MIFKTIEFIPSDIDSTLDSLQTDVTAGKYDDILTNYCFLTFTEKGLTLVKQDKSIVTNATIDLSDYIKSEDIENKYVVKLEGYSLISNNEIERLSKITNYNDENITKQITELSDNLSNNYTKTVDLPKFSFLEDGTLSITIDNVTHRYAPITTV